MKCSLTNIALVIMCSYCIVQAYDDEKYILDVLKKLIEKYEILAKQVTDLQSWKSSIEESVKGKYN